MRYKKFIGIALSLIIILGSSTFLIGQIRYRIIRGIITGIARTIISNEIRKSENPNFEDRFDISVTDPDLIGYVHASNPYFLYKCKRFWNTTELDLDHVSIELYAGDSELEDFYSYEGYLIAICDLESLEGNHYYSDFKVKLNQIDNSISQLRYSEAEKFLVTVYTGIDSEGNRHLLSTHSWTPTFEFAYNSWSNSLF